MHNGNPHSLHLRCLGCATSHAGQGSLVHKIVAGVTHRHSGVFTALTTTSPGSVACCGPICTAMTSRLPSTGMYSVVSSPVDTLAMMGPGLPRAALHLWPQAQCGTCRPRYFMSLSKLKSTKWSKALVAEATAAQLSWAGASITVLSLPDGAHQGQQAISPCLKHFKPL